MTAEELWTRALQELQLTTTRVTFDTWLRGSRGLELRDNTLVVGVRHAYAVDWLSNRLELVVHRALRHAGGPDLAVDFVVAPAQKPGTQQDPASNLHLSEPVFEAVREERVTHDGQGHALTWSDFYIKFKVAFRKSALRRLKGAKLSVFLCLALHVDRDGIAHPGVEAIMSETGYGRATVCSALAELESIRLIRKCDRRHTRAPDSYEVRGYAWFGSTAAPSLWEMTGGS